jgi:hypothetical protein
MEFLEQIRLSSVYIIGIIAVAAYLIPGVRFALVDRYMLRELGRNDLSNHMILNVAWLGFSFPFRMALFYLVYEFSLVKESVATLLIVFFLVALFFVPYQMERTIFKNNFCFESFIIRTFLFCGFSLLEVFNIDPIFEKNYVGYVFISGSTQILIIFFIAQFFAKLIPDREKILGVQRKLVNAFYYYVIVGGFLYWLDTKVFNLVVEAGPPLN